jgi:hypothetical protein
MQGHALQLVHSNGLEEHDCHASLSENLVFAVLLFIAEFGDYGDRQNFESGKQLKKARSRPFVVVEGIVERMV